MYLIRNSNYPTKKTVLQYKKNITRCYRNVFAKDAIAAAGKRTASAIILNMQQLSISGWGLATDRHRCCNKWSTASTAFSSMNYTECTKRKFTSQNLFQT
jgi:hypothetical protein